MAEGKEVTTPPQPSTPTHPSGIYLPFLDKLLAGATTSQAAFFVFLFWLAAIAFGIQAGTGFSLFAPPQPIDTAGRIGFGFFSVLTFVFGVLLGRQAGQKVVKEADEQKAILFLANLLAKEREATSDQISQNIINALDELIETKRETTAIDVYRKLVSINVINKGDHVKFTRKMLDTDKSL